MKTRIHQFQIQNPVDSLAISKAFLGTSTQREGGRVAASLKIDSCPGKTPKLTRLGGQLRRPKTMASHEELLTIMYPKEQDHKLPPNLLGKG